MIVYVKGPSGRGFLSLLCRGDRQWEPIKTKLFASPEDAIQECIAEVVTQLDDLDELVQLRKEMLVSNISWLQARPCPVDTVRVFGQVCELDSDGAIIMPEQRKPGDGPPRGVEIWINEPVYKALRKSMELRGVPRVEARKLMVDAMLNQPMELLVAVADKAKGMLHAVAEVMAEVGSRYRDHLASQRSGEASGGRNGEPPDDPDDPLVS